MVARIVLDAVGVNPSLVGTALLGCFVAMVLVEGGILALLGMRPIGKAFTSSFLVNMAALGAGFVLFIIAIQLGIPGMAVLALTAGGATLVQGLVLSANRFHLSRGRAWLAALAMKGGSMLLLLALAWALDF